jgi:phage baseplate assembly protein W
MPQTIPNRYSDLNLAFLANPITGDVSRLTNEDAVKQAVANLVLTQYYERPFHPEIGCNVTTMLFENIMPLTAQNIQRSIQDVIKNFEPRVQLISVVVTPDIGGNGYNCTITFYVLNVTDAVSVSFFLERLR